MNVLLREDQHKRLQKYQLLKKIFYKYWDSKGPGYDETFLKVFDIPRNGITEHDVQNMLVDYLGKNKAIGISFKFLRGSHKIKNGECGSYEFTFSFDKVTFNNENSTLDILVLIDVETGFVEIQGEESVKLSEAFNDYDYGNDVKIEVTECVYSYLYDNITEKTGINFNVKKFLDSETRNTI